MLSFLSESQELNTLFSRGGSYVIEKDKEAGKILDRQGLTRMGSETQCRESVGTRLLCSAGRQGGSNWH